MRISFSSRYICRKVVLLTVGLGVTTTLAADRNPSLDKKIGETLSTKRTDLIELRRDLHRHPEVSGEEERTARVVAERLRALGLEVRTDVGGHGVVGVLKGGQAGPVVAFRADMDAVLSDAPDPVPFASETPGVRHICGHDVHTTVAVGIAEALAAVRDELRGTVKFIFQPSEENGEGARAMIGDGVMGDPAPQAIFAVHCAPLETGTVGSGEGMMLPGLDVVNVMLSGDGDLAIAAEQCSQVISGVSTTDGPSSEDEAGGLSEGDGESEGFITAGVFGSERQPGKDQWVVQVMVRASSDELHMRAKEAIEKGLAAIEVPGVSYELTYTREAIAAVMNDPGLVRRANDVIRSVVGEDAVIPIDEPTPFFSEDFAFFQKEVPGVMFFLGVSNEAEGILGLPHHSMFAVDERAIGIGARAMTMVLVDYLETH